MTTLRLRAPEPTSATENWNNLADRFIARARLMNGRAFDYVQQRFAEYLRGKRVGIVGGGLRDNFIPVHDCEVWVRVNGHLAKQRGPCDVLYHTVVAEPPLTPDFLGTALRGQSIQFVFLNLVDGDYDMTNRDIPLYYPFIKRLRALHPDCEIGFFAQGTWEERNPYGPQHEWLNELHKAFNAKFFTGLIALADILRTEAAEVTVYGMDLFVEKTGGKLEGKVESHEIEGNVRFAQWLYSGDPRLSCDGALRGALERYGHPVERT